jgi:hypothetical protein
MSVEQILGAGSSIFGDVKSILATLLDLGSTIAGS